MAWHEITNNCMINKLLMTWHDMTWHDMTWRDMIWREQPFGINKGDEYNSTSRIKYSRIKVEPRHRVTSLIRSTRYYGHFFCPGQPGTPMHFPIRKPPSCGHPVNAANGHIVKSECVHYLQCTFQIHAADTGTHNFWRLPSRRVFSREPIFFLN